MFWWRTKQSCGRKEGKQLFFPSRKQTQTFQQRGHSEAKQLVVSCHHPPTPTPRAAHSGGGLSSALPGHPPSETQTPGMGHAPPSCCLRTLHLFPSPPSGQLGNHSQALLEMPPGRCRRCRRFWRCRRDPSCSSCPSWHPAYSDTYFYLPSCPTTAGVENSKAGLKTKQFITEPQFCDTAPHTSRCPGGVPAVCWVPKEHLPLFCSAWTCRSEVGQTSSPCGKQVLPQSDKAGTSKFLQPAAISRLPLPSN